MIWLSPNAKWHIRIQADMDAPGIALALIHRTNHRKPKYIGRFALISEETMRNNVAVARTKIPGYIADQLATMMPAYVKERS